MKDHADLKIIANVSEQKELIEKLEQNFNNSGWKRNLEKEKKYALKYSGIGDCFIFTCSKTESRPAAELSFHRDENGYLYVSNIVPENIGRINVDTYNSILEEFLTEFLEPATQSLNIEIILIPSERNIDNSMSPEMAQLLKKFLSMANIADGGTHQFDEERLFDFIIQAHNEKSLLKEQVLSGLLADNNWPEMQAQEIVSKYLFGKDLLNHYSRTKF
ncbi:MAG: hypothetical protein VKL42_21260 [Snowella sp.]|nr:hypothetical protein [Snowella sp.]